MSYVPTKRFIWKKADWLKESAKGCIVGDEFRRYNLILFEQDAHTPFYQTVKGEGFILKDSLLRAPLASKLSG
jgi:hypothetical protein